MTHTSEWTDHPSSGLCGKQTILPRVSSSDHTASLGTMTALSSPAPHLLHHDPSATHRTWPNPSPRAIITPVLRRSLDSGCFYCYLSVSVDPWFKLWALEFGKNVGDYMDLWGHHETNHGKGPHHVHGS